MFGKINFGFSQPSKPTQNNSQLQNKIAPQPQTFQRKSYLSNPTFAKKVDNNKNTKQPNGKEQKPQEVQTAQNSNKTKQIKKATTNNFVQNKEIKAANKKNSAALSIEHQMQGSKFRILNQLLYTTSSQQAMNHFKQNPQDYLTYHSGYRYQSQKWQSKPVNVIMKYLRKSFKEYKDKVICDLGCGEGFLYEGLTKEKYQKEDEEGKVVEVKNKHVFNEKNIFSFDLVSLKPFIKVADITNLPLDAESADLAVFCLSLMGKNYLHFIEQAHRVLKKGTGELIIAEVQSRSKNWKAFSQMIEMVGFHLTNNGVSLGTKVEFNHRQGRKVSQNKGKYFRVLHFAKNPINAESTKKIRFQDNNYAKEELAQLSQQLLTECIYKKR